MRPPRARRYHAPPACENRAVSARRVAALAVLLVPAHPRRGSRRRRRVRAFARDPHPGSVELATYRPDIVTEIRGADGSTIARFAISAASSSTARTSGRDGEGPARRRGRAFLRLQRNRPRPDRRRRLKDIATRACPGRLDLTQQPRARVFLTVQKTWARKINEVLLTVEIEKQFSGRTGIRRCT